MGRLHVPGWAENYPGHFNAWSATHYVLQQLVDLGLDPASPQARHAVGLVREHVRWEHGGEPYFDGEVEACINGVALRTAAYFRQDAATIVETLRAGRLADGGWNCWADYGATVSSFHSTVCVVEGLLESERAGHDDAEAREARLTGEEYLLARGLFRRLSDGAVADPRMTMLSYPVRWFHDVLRGLEHFRLADRRDPRLTEAVDLVRSKADAHGLWRLENHHEGPSLLDLGEGEGFPSRWVTLRALRVLRWWDAASR